MTTIKVNPEGYKTIHNILLPEDIVLYKRYFELLFQNSQLNLENKRKTTNTNSLGYYSDVVGESLLLDLLPIVEEASSKKLFPTYSYQRMYLKGGRLRKHKDRPSCEVSCTMSIDYDSSEKKWPIFIELEGKEIPVNLNRGEALVYRGCETKHWRGIFTGNYSTHLFLHYVEKEGTRSAYKYDKRSMIFGKNNFRQVLKSRVITLENLNNLNYNSTLYPLLNIPFVTTENGKMVVLHLNKFNTIRYPKSKQAFIVEVFSKSDSFAISQFKTIKEEDVEAINLMKKLILLGCFGLNN